MSASSPTTGLITGIIGAPSGTGKSHFIAASALSNPALFALLADGDEVIEKNFGWPQEPDWWRDAKKAGEIETRTFDFLSEWSKQHGRIVLFNSPRASVCVRPPEDTHRAYLLARAATPAGSRFPGVDILLGAQKRYAHAQFTSIEEAIRHVLEKQGAGYLLPAAQSNGKMGEGAATQVCNEIQPQTLAEQR